MYGFANPKDYLLARRDKAPSLEDKCCFICALLFTCCFLCQKYRIYTVYIWFWPTLFICVSCLHAVLFVSVVCMLFRFAGTFPGGRTLLYLCAVVCRLFRFAGTFPGGQMLLYLCQLLTCCLNSRAPSLEDKRCFVRALLLKCVHVG